MKYKGTPIDQISLFNTPKLYSELVIQLLKDGVLWGKSILLSQGLTLAVTVATWILIANVEIFESLYSFIIFALYWILLGVASSIGLGTGLHTFILYLGPHIAKVALSATMCGKVPEMLPSRWNFNHFGQCNKGYTIGIFGIILAVQLQSFLWGLGTAIGQLPPYFVAKKAAQTRIELLKMESQAQGQCPQTSLLNSSQNDLDSETSELKELKTQLKIHTQMPPDQIQQMIQLRHRTDLSLVQRAKLFIYSNMQKYGFWAILVCASIPNPLFDLAGITSGHFRIPFKTFFSATLIGKAIIKVHLQMIFIIAIFRKQSLAFLIKFLQKISSSLADSFLRSFEASKKQFNQPHSYKQHKSFVSVLWDLFITGMVLYFLKSILDAYVKEKAITLRDI